MTATARRPSLYNMVYSTMTELKQATASEIKNELYAKNKCPTSKELVGFLKTMVGEGKLQFIPKVHGSAGVYVLVEGKEETVSDTQRVNQMKVKISKEQLTELMNAASIVSDQLRIHSDANGWSLTDVDPAHVAMVRYTMPTSAFIEYEPEEMDFAITIDRVKSILSIADSDIEIEVKDEIVFRTGNITRRTGIIEYDGKAPKIPNLTLNKIATIDSKEVLKVVKDASFGDAITFVTNDRGTTVSVEGDTDYIDMLASEDALEEEIKASYPREYLITAMRLLPREVSISYNTDYPIICQSEVNGCSVMCLIAPRIETGQETD